MKLAGLVFLASHSATDWPMCWSSVALEAQLQDDGQPFETPPGITCREAGTAWETRAFGSQVLPICVSENNLMILRGLCIQSSAWNYDMMKMNENWIHQLFTESHWATAQQPLQPPVDKFARYAIIGDELLGDLFGERYNLSKKSKEHDKDVHVETGISKKKYLWSSTTMKKHGCKRVNMEPSPKKDLPCTIRLLTKLLVTQVGYWRPRLK